MWWAEESEKWQWCRDFHGNGWGALPDFPACHHFGINGLPDGHANQISRERDTILRCCSDEGRLPGPFGSRISKRVAKVKRESQLHQPCGECDEQHTDEEKLHDCGARIIAPHGSALETHDARYGLVEHLPE